MGRGRREVNPFERTDRRRSGLTDLVGERVDGAGASCHGRASWAASTTAKRLRTSWPRLGRCRGRDPRRVTGDG
jgi:hypothetical protein